MLSEGTSSYRETRPVYLEQPALLQQFGCTCVTLIPFDWQGFHREIQPGYSLQGWAVSLARDFPFAATRQVQHYSDVEESNLPSDTEPSRRAPFLEVWEHGQGFEDLAATATPVHENARRRAYGSR